MRKFRFTDFYNYLLDVVEYYRKNNSLSGFTSVALKHKIGGITKEQFFSWGLSNPNTIITRELSDRLRLAMLTQRTPLCAEIVMAPINTPAPETIREHHKQTEEHKLTPDAETKQNPLDALSKKVACLNHCWWNLAKSIGSLYQDQVKVDMGDQYDESLFSRYDYEFNQLIKPWCEDIEYRMAHATFSGMKQEDICKAIPEMDYFEMHAFLTYIFYDCVCGQKKLDFDARGRESINDSIEEILAEWGVFNDVLFHKIESWKGNVHMCIVYKDAPDVMMIISGEDCHFFTIKDDLLYNFDGATIIDPEHASGFSGWGTRAIIGQCIQHIFQRKEEAIEVQRTKVTPQMKGKLMDDMSHLDLLRTMYNEYA